MKQEFLIGGGATLLSATGTATQPNETLQTISLVITIVGALISMVILPLLTWWRNAKKDGKITKEEVKEGVETLAEGAKNVSQILDDKKKGDK